MHIILPAMQMRRRMIVRMDVDVRTGCFVHAFPFMETPRRRGLHGKFPPIVVLRCENPLYYVFRHLLFVPGRIASAVGQVIQIVFGRAVPVGSQVLAVAPVDDVNRCFAPS